jgi:hypothetical protein
MAIRRYFHLCHSCRRWNFMQHLNVILLILRYCLYDNCTSMGLLVLIACRISLIVYHLYCMMDVYIQTLLNLHKQNAVEKNS